mmetsp:Transcript_23827/g.36753  ORF Transcript_23827/g.36753 Transcript_23827/m.36753 type:complete len:517 (+) Transcript_23827:218-1768(+)|eukprot:CAMPEP_0196802252 /NCGR_PEP_ID=MMETSP1362-20130617/1889_1 /TAXON_ID=163516 /ORGANISM="Leptocylindrus danicus, Strain CCMP1856" /LENGTH=516 /DNA_ID=CAMNT_0042173495 /DNA_START=214 /DNA_END=1764 /DNA_ORIENTATION=-
MRKQHHDNGTGQSPLSSSSMTSTVFEPKTASVSMSRQYEIIERQHEHHPNVHASALVMFLSAAFTISENSRRMIAQGESFDLYGEQINRVPSQSPSLGSASMESLAPAPANWNATVSTDAFGSLSGGAEDDGSFGSGPYLLIGLMICMFVGVLHITRWKPTYGICQEKRMAADQEDNIGPLALELEELGQPQRQQQQQQQRAPLEEEECQNLDQYFLTRIGVGMVPCKKKMQDDDMMPEQSTSTNSDESSSSSEEEENRFASGAVHSLVFEFADGSRTGKIFDDVDGLCELSPSDPAVVERRIGPLSCSHSWHVVKPRDHITHIAGTRGSGCHLFQHITLFTSTNQIFSFGDNSVTFTDDNTTDTTAMLSNNFNIQIPHTREAMRNIFSVPAIGLPIIVRDVGRRLQLHEYKFYTGELHMILMEASCDSTLVPNKRSWEQIEEYLRLRREHDERALAEEALSQQGLFNWTPLHIACNVPAPTSIILSLYRVAPRAGSLKDKFGYCPSIPRSVRNGL